MADDELAENSEGPRRKTYTPPAEDAVFTGSFPVVDDADVDPSPLGPVVPPVALPTSAIAPPVRTSLGDAEILAKFSGEVTGSTAEMMNELERQVTLREDEEEAFTMWANLTRATRGSEANKIIERERIIFDGGDPELLVEAPDDDVVDTEEVQAELPEPIPATIDIVEVELPEEAPDTVDSEPIPEEGHLPDSAEEPVTSDEIPVAESVDSPVGGDQWPLEQSESNVSAESRVASEEPAGARTHSDRIGLEATPDNHKTLTRVGIFWLWWATLTPIIGLVAGAFFISRGLGVLETLAVVGSGAVISGLIIAASAYAGARTGLSTAHTSQLTFGRLGARAPSILLVLIRIALLGVLVLAAESLITRVVVLSNWWPFEMWIVRVAGAVVVGGIVITLGVLGGRVLRVALYVSAAVSGLAIAGFVALSAPSIGVWAIDSWSASAPTVVALGSLALIGFLLLFGHTGGDLARYSSGSAVGSVSALSGLIAVVPTVVFVAYVAWVAAAMPALASTLVSDPVGSFAGELPPWFPVPLILGLVVPLIILSALALFSGGLATLSAGLPVSRRAGTVILGALALGGAGAAIAFDHRISQYFPDVLYLVGVVLVAWGGAYAVDIALGRQRLAELKTDELPVVRVAPLVGFVVAVALGWGLITSGVSWLFWLGYAFPLLSLAGLVDLSAAQPGVLVALVVASLISAIAAWSKRSVRAGAVDG